ncbi:MAG: hypothetical protein QW520_01885 [Methanomassiliicoccales archaeon]
MNIIIPSGSLESQQKIILRRVSLSNTSYIAETAFELRPDDISFKRPIQIRIMYDSSKVPNERSESDLCLGRLE